MESDYDDGNQIAGEEGDLVVFSLVTYGYGEEIAWSELRRMSEELSAWASEHGLDHAISVSANYW